MGLLMNFTGLSPSAEGTTTTPGNLIVTGKVGFNGATPVGKVAEVPTLSTTLSLALLTEVVTALNATNKALNETKAILKSVGLTA